MELASFFAGASELVIGHGFHALPRLFLFDLRNLFLVLHAASAGNERPLYSGGLFLRLFHQKRQPIFVLDPGVYFVAQDDHRKKF